MARERDPILLSAPDNCQPLSPPLEFPILEEENNNNDHHVGDNIMHNNEEHTIKSDSKVTALDVTSKLAIRHYRKIMKLQQNELLKRIDNLKELKVSYCSSKKSEIK